MKIYVIKQNVPIGYLEEKTFNKISFVYFDNIKTKSYLPGLDQQENFSQNGLFTVFNNFLPENNQIGLLKKKYSIKSNIEILLYLENIHGSYEFLSEEEFSSFKLKKESKIILYQDVKKDILMNDYTYPNILENYKLDIDNDIIFPSGIENSKVIGLSGFQYKFSINLNQKEQIITLGQSNKNEYFIKPYSKYYSKFIPKEKDRLYIPYLLINEHLFMSMAKDLGFEVPYNAIIKQEHDYHYIIKRYDRYEGFSFDHEEIATLMGIESSKKYSPTFKDIFEKAKEYLRNDKLYELINFVIFSIIIAHGDLHSKNISFINNSNSLTEEEKTISPYYDISTTSIYKGIVHKDIGLKVLNKTSKINRKDILEFAKLVELNEDKVNESIDNICNFFIDNFQNKYIRLLPNEIKALPFHKQTYGKPESFESILNKYYLQRCHYIKTSFGIEKIENFF